MHHAMTRATLIAGLLLAATGLGQAQDLAAQRPAPVSGSLAEAAVQVTPALLAGLPRVTQTVSLVTSKGAVAGTFEGVLLWEMVKKAGLGAKEGGSFPDLRQSFLVTGRDGYAVAVSMGEIAPEYGNRPIMIADSVDGRSLLPQDGFRLVAPGDKRAGRSVRDVVAITLR